VSGARQAAFRASRALDRFGSAIDRVSPARGVLVLVAATLLVWTLQTIAWPVVAGRDLGTYLRYYAQMWEAHAVFPQAMLGRTPGTPLVAGLTLEAGPLAVEVAMLLLFVASVASWTLAAAAFGRRVAALVAAILLLYPGYGGLFHQFSSDALSAAAFAVWALAATRVSLRPTASRFALLGAGLVLLVLIRPGNQVLLAFGLVPLVLGGPWRARILRSGAYLSAAVFLLVLFAGYNKARYDDFVVARGTNIAIPFFRAFVEDRSVSPENGPASRRLARAVERRLLPEEPYRSYGIDPNEFFSSGSDRMLEDVASLTDRVFGWDSDYAILRDAGVEAVQKHPGTYTRGVATTLWRLLRSPAYVTPPSSAGGDDGAGRPETIVVDGRTLPKPSEGELIPGSHQGLWASTPDNRIQDVWTSPTEHHLVFRDPRDKARAEAVDAEIDRLLARLPDRRGNATLAHRLNQAAYRFPPPVLWLAIGLVALAIRRSRHARIVLGLAGAALLVLFVTALGIPAAGEYAMPFVPAFALLAGVALLGPRSTRRA
jgi:hypothetical protein